MEKKIKQDAYLTQIDGSKVLKKGVKKVQGLKTKIECEPRYFKASILLKILWVNDIPEELVLANAKIYDKIRARVLSSKGEMELF